MHRSASLPHAHLLAQAREHIARGEPTLAVKPAFEALWTAENDSNAPAECDARATYARALSQSGDHLSAMVQYQRAYITAKALKDVPLQSTTLEGLGHCFLALEGYGDAQRSFRGAIAAAELTGDMVCKATACAEMIRVLCRYSQHLRESGNRTAALRNSKRALKLADQYSADVDVAGTPLALRLFFRINRAYALIQNHQFVEGNAILRAVLNSRSILHGSRSWAASMALCAYSEFEQGHYEENAKQLAALAAELERSGHRDVLLVVRGFLVQSLEHIGRFPEALAEQRQQIQLLRALGRDVLANRSRIAHLQAEIEQQRQRARRFRSDAQHWQTEAHIDALTGLHARRKLEDAIHHADAVRVKGRTALMVDLDFFKGINDQFGHAIGDEVLARAAQQLQRAIRELGLTKTVAAYRYGGEEFALVGARLTDVRGNALATRSCELIKCHAWNEIAPGLSVTASIGLAQGPDTLAHALQVADAALYRAKREGRDRVVRA